MKHNVINNLFVENANIFKSLSHPKRLEIIHLLRDQSLPVTDIYQMLDLPQANLSQHLQVLRENKIVKTKKKGKQVFYQVAHKNYLKACDLIRQVLQQDQKLTDILDIKTDPICGMRLTSISAAHIYEHNGVTNYFCASGCLKQFRLNEAVQKRSKPRGSGPRKLLRSGI